MYNTETKMYVNNLGETVPELFGITELGMLIGWNTQKTHTYYKREKFIEPIIKVGNRPFWTKKQVDIILEKNIKEC